MNGTYPPGPRDGLFGITFHHPFKTDPLGFAVNVAREHGDFACVQVGWVRVYFVNRPELIREVLTTKVKSFRKLHRQMQALRKIEGEGLVVSDGGIWARHRPFVQGSFHSRHMQAYAQVVVERTRRRLERWQPDTAFDLAAEMNELAMEIIAEVVFGVDLSERVGQLRDAVHVARAAMQQEMGSALPLPDWLPLPGKLRQRRALRTVDRLIWDLLRERQASGAARADMLGQMLAAAAGLNLAAPIAPAEIRDEAATLFVAGHDTTSASLAWVWYALSQNPKIEERAIQEIDQALAGRPPTFEDLPRLKYVEMVVKETMRLYPASAFLFGREALEPVELAGYQLRRGAWVFISPYIVQHDARNFPEPERFDPERFAPGRINEIPPYAYIPFGGGPRICIGNAFAVMEMTLLTATVLQRYRLCLDQPPPALELEIVLRPKDGLRMRAVPRERQADRPQAA
jgi:cytochrome P450